jgi:hypothetical protein
MPALDSMSPSTDMSLLLTDLEASTPRGVELPE